MTCKCHPNSPFHWWKDERPSIFLQDVAFRAKGAIDKSIGQVQTDYLDTKRAEGVSVGYMHGISKQLLAKEEKLLAYKQFGIFSRARPMTKPALNKHEK